MKDNKYFNLFKRDILTSRNEVVAVEKYLKFIERRKELEERLLDELPDPLTIKQFSIYMSIGKHVIGDKIRAGEIKAFKIKHLWFITKEEVYRLLKKYEH